MPDQFGNALVPPAGTDTLLAGSPDDSAAQAYYAELAPYLGVVIGEGERLAELGQSRSRDILELSVRMDRFREASSALLAFLDGQPPPAALQSLVADLRSQLWAADVAIEASISAIRGFNWDALGGAVEDFDRAVAEIARIGSRKIE